MAYLVAADAHVSEGLVVSRRGGPGFVRAVRLASYGRASERVRFAFDVLHSRLLDSYTSIGGARSQMRLGLLSAGARAPIERVSASEGGAIRAVASADVAASESAEARPICGRNGVHRGFSYRFSVQDDDISARFRQIGSSERDVTSTQCVSGHE